MISRRTRIWIWLAGIVVAWILVVVALVVRQENAVEAYKREQRAKGEKLTIEENIPAPVPPEENGAEIANRAFATLRAFQTVLDSNAPSAMKMIAPGRAMIGWAQPEVRSDDATNSWAEIERALAFYEGSLRLLEELIQRPRLDFQLDYDKNFLLLLPHLSLLKGASLKLAAAASADLNRHDTAAATQRLRTTLALVKGMENEPLAISQLVALAMSAITATATWELLQSPNVTDEELQKLQADWAALDFASGIERALAMERAMGDTMLETMRNSPAEYRRMMSYGSGSGGSSSGLTEFLNNPVQKSREAAGSVMWRLSWSHSDQLRMLKGYQVLLETARFALTNQHFLPVMLEQTNRLAAVGIYTDFSGGVFDSELRKLFSMGVESLDKSISRVFKSENTRRVAITAIALKRYQLKHGDYPETLDRLMPEFLKTVPLDPADGKPLRYYPGMDGTFVPYSIGADGVDNGGNPAPATSKRLYWLDGLDYVWPTTATPDEVEAYWSSPTK